MLGGTPGLHRTQFADLSRGRIGVLRKSTGEKMSFQKYDDNLKIAVDSVTTLATDLGIDTEFPISKLRKKIYLFVYEGVMNQLQIPSSNSRSLQQMDDLPYYLSAI
ncbi:uncharacterized protein TNCV_4199691 [Trichonephila clavipes]|uniref:Uncharacterized protein n=1 Tax=Trichonephila clavipes TaxID=2585209 RepID=A0A8X6WAY3_TRICX|nr:uncharacterized protein TNCV_4199691 [Trichonephila clavipes]